MKTIVIFGATGNTGAYFVDYCKMHLDQNEYEIVAVGRKNTDFFKKLNVRYEQIDIRNKDEFSRLPKNIYAAVNMAGVLPAYLAGSNCIYPYVEANIIGGINIIDYAHKSSANRMLYTQTWAELAGYWGKSEVLSPQMPRNLVYTGDHAFYTISKSFIVDAMQYYWQEFGLRSFVFRMPNIYMYSPVKEYYVEGNRKKIGYRYMIDRAKIGAPIELWGNPDAYKDIVYVKDFCQMMCRALLAQVNGGIYHVGTGVKTTLRQQIEGIIQIFSPKSHPSEIIACPDKPSFTSFVMDIENARIDLGYNPEYYYLDYLMDYKREEKQKRFSALWE